MGNMGKRLFFGSDYWLVNARWLAVIMLRVRFYPIREIEGEKGEMAAQRG